MTRYLNFAPHQIAAALRGELRQVRTVLKDQPESCDHAAYKAHGAEWWDKPTEFYEVWPGEWACRYCGNGVKLDVIRKDATGFRLPFAPGDIIGGRETWVVLRRVHWFDQSKPKDWVVPHSGRANAVAYGFDIKPGSEGDDIRKEYGYKWRSPVTQPAWAIRHWLRVVTVRVERVQDVTEKGAKAEGITTALSEDTLSGGQPNYGLPEHFTPYRYRFGLKRLFDSLHGPGSWDANLFTAVAEVEPTEKPK